MAKTRKAKAKGKASAKAKVLKVDAAYKIKGAEKVLNNGSITFVLIYAEWCGACHRFMKNIWNPSCTKSAKHQRIAIREDMVRNTSLANANFKYLPSLILVDEKGQMQNFKTPEGDTNAMPTPKNKEELNRIVNVPVLPASSPSLEAKTDEPETLGFVNNTRKMNNTLGLVNNTRKANNRVNNRPANRLNNRVNNAELLNTPQTNNVLTTVPRVQKNNSIPNGKIYTPTPQIAPESLAAANDKQKGGANALPAAILGSLAMLLRRKTRKNKI
jgi:thiol-disulfide isomerase/thioredoxin